jgi:hypothetical protein
MIKGLTLYGPMGLPSQLAGKRSMARRVVQIVYTTLTLAGLTWGNRNLLARLECFVKGKRVHLFDPFKFVPNRLLRSPVGTESGCDRR